MFLYSSAEVNKDFPNITFSLPLVRERGGTKDFKDLNGWRWLNLCDITRMALWPRSSTSFNLMLKYEIGQINWLHIRNSKLFSSFQNLL